MTPVARGLPIRICSSRYLTHVRPFPLPCLRLREVANSAGPNAKWNSSRPTALPLKSPSWQPITGDPRTTGVDPKRPFGRWLGVPSHFLSHCFGESPDFALLQRHGRTARPRAAAADCEDSAVRARVQSFYLAHYDMDRSIAASRKAFRERVRARLPQL